MAKLNVLKIYIDISQMEHGRPNRTIISLLYSKIPK